MSPWLFPAIGAGVGLLKYGGDKEAAKRERHLQATLMATAPWTGVGPDKGSVDDPTILGNVVDGGMLGLKAAHSLGARPFKDSTSWWDDDAAADATSRTLVPDQEQVFMGSPSEGAYVAPPDPDKSVWSVIPNQTYVGY